MKERYKTKVSLQEIADSLNVSRMTISRYLKDPHLVSERKRNKIAQAIKEHAYIPNVGPSILSRRKSNTIGIILPSLSNQIFTDVLTGIDNIASLYKNNLMITYSNNDQEREEKCLRMLLSYNIDGVILTERNHSDLSIKMLAQAKIPIVEIMDSVSPCIDMAVGFDYKKAAKNITQLMVNKGYKNIVYLAREDERSRFKEQGYRECLSAHNLQPFVVVAKEHSSFSLGREMLKQILIKYPKVDAIFSTNDDLSVGALLECYYQKINVPDQIGIAGFHGLNISYALEPKLTTVSTPRLKIGEQAAEMLINRINNQPIAQKVIELATSIILGETI